MDPVSAIGLVGSVVGIVDVITKSVAYLSGLQSSYKIVDLKVKLMIGQLSTLKAALEQVSELINSRPDLPKDNKLVKDLCVALSCVEAVILAVDDRLSDLQRNEKQGLKSLSKIGFVWDEQTINDYLSLLNNQVNALNLFLTALQCRTTVEQTQVVEGPECQSLLRLIKDDTSSLLWLRDSESIGTCQSTGTQDLGTINATFEFDTEIFASKVYRTATRSSMLRALLSDAAPDDQKSFIGRHSKSGVRSLRRGFLGRDFYEHPGTPNTEFQRLYLPSALPNHTLHPLQTIKSLSPKTNQLAGSALSISWQQRVERRLSRRGLANNRSPDQGAIYESRTEKVLVLGTSESGKSTLIKSLKIGYMGGYNEEERLRYKPTILENLWEATKAIAEAVVEKVVMISVNFSPQQTREYEMFLAACAFLKASTARDIYGQLVTGLRAFRLHLRRDISSAIETIWKEKQSHEILRKLTSASSADKHFANSSDRILTRDYIPTDEDILYCRTTTTGMYETELYHGGTVCRFFDLGGTMAERKKWTQTFDNVNAIIFTCDVSCYDTVHFGSGNRMSEQILLFESVVNSAWSVHGQIVVLFTKEDTLTPEKLRISPFQSWFPDYDGNPESTEDILDYLAAQFRQKEENGGTSNAVFCRSGSLASSTTRMGEVVMNALPWSRRGAFSE